MSCLSGGWIWRSLQQEKRTACEAAGERLAQTDLPFATAWIYLVVFLGCPRIGAVERQLSWFVIASQELGFLRKPRFQVAFLIGWVLDERGGR